MSFFDDGEDTEPRPSPRAPRAGAPVAPQRPRPRTPQGAAGPSDEHSVMVRRRWAAGIGLALLVLIIVIVAGCLSSDKQQKLKDYNHTVGELARESDSQITRPLFGALTDASSKSALNVEVQIDQLRMQAQKIADRAKALSVPSEVTNAQRNLLLVLDLRAEGVTKIAALTPTALGGQGKQAITQIAGDLEIFLASDVIYSQRVVPLIQQELSSAGAQGIPTAASRSLPNLGWLEPTTVQSRITGQAASAQNPQAAAGTHGSALISVSAGGSKLEPEPTINHVAGGGNPTFTATVEDAGSNPETNVTVNVTVTASGKQFKTSHVIEKAEPGKTVNVDIPVSGVPLGVASKIEVAVQPVPGETNAENNKGTFLAIFGK